LTSTHLIGLNDFMAIITLGFKKMTI
jgi:hypothetical protein